MIVLSWLWKIWFLCYMLISTIVFYPFLLLSIVLLKNYNLTFKIYKIWGWSICIFLGIVPKLSGKNKLPPKNGYIIVANHSSQLDIIVPYALFKNHFAFLAKKELEKLPLFNINFKGMNVTVDRKNMVSGMESLKSCRKKIEQGINLLIFPEGTKNRLAPKLARFKNGPFKLAMECNCPIVPVVFKHNYKRFGADFAKTIASPGWSEIEVLDTLYPKDFLTEVNPLEAIKKHAFNQMDAAIKQSSNN